MDTSRRGFASSFGQASTDPAKWLEQAQSFRTAAEALLESLPRLVQKLEPGADVRVTTLACVEGHMLLMGFAFEYLLKAMAAARGRMLLNQSGTFGEPYVVAGPLGVTVRSGHSLIALVEALELHLAPEEIAWLRQLEAYVQCAGRYPAPLAAMRAHIERQTGEGMRWQTSDHSIGGRLFDRLSRGVDTTWRQRRKGKGA